MEERARSLVRRFTAARSGVDEEADVPRDVAVEVSVARRAVELPAAAVARQVQIGRRQLPVPHLETRRVGGHRAKHLARAIPVVAAANAHRVHELKVRHEPRRLGAALLDVVKNGGARGHVPEKNYAFVAFVDEQRGRLRRRQRRQRRAVDFSKAVRYPRLGVRSQRRLHGGDLRGRPLWVPVVRGAHTAHIAAAAVRDGALRAGRQREQRLVHFEVVERSANGRRATCGHGFGTDAGVNVHIATLQHDGVEGPVAAWRRLRAQSPEEELLLESILVCVERGVEPGQPKRVAGAQRVVGRCHAPATIRPARRWVRRIFRRGSRLIAKIPADDQDRSRGESQAWVAARRHPARRAR